MRRAKGLPYSLHQQYSAEAMSLISERVRSGIRRSVCFHK